MKKTIKKALIIVSAVSILALASCSFGFIGIKGSGSIASRTWDKGSFSKVRIDHIIHATIETGTACAVTLTTDDNILEKYVGIFLDGDILTVTMDPGYSYNDVTVNAKITLPALTSITVHGNASADVKFPSKGTTASFVAEAEGNASVTMSLNVDSLQLKSSGNSKMEFDGTANNIVISSSGNSHVKQTGTLNLADVTAEGNSGVEINASSVKDLSLNLRGNSNLTVQKAETANGSMEGNAELIIRDDCPLRHIIMSGNAHYTWK